MSDNLLDKFKLNQFALQFVDARDQEELTNNLMKIKNSQGMSKEEIDFQNHSWGFASEDDANYIDFMPIFESKRARISKYREMALYPEISDAIENHVNDAIVDNGDGKIIDLDVKAKKVPATIKKRIDAAFDYYIHNILNFNEKGDELFKKWLIEGELFGELITNDKGDNIIGLKILPSFTMAPLYKAGVLKGYTQQSNIIIRDMRGKELDKVDFEPNQIAYANYGEYGENEYDVRGFFERTVKTYNQLKSLEDSIVIYRLVRAVDRRVWNIYTGRMPKGKAEEYLKQVMKKYKTKNLYDPSTGSIDSAQNMMSMSHDIWFAKDETGNGTTVDTLNAGMNLGEITDLDWFREKLFKSLKLPTSRWNTEQKQQPYSSGKMGEVAREEINYARFIEKLQRKFKSFILGPFLTLLRMRKIPEEYTKKELYDIKFAKSNLFKEYKEIELREARLGTLSSIAGYIVSRDNVNQPEGLFSKEFVLKNYFKMTDEEYEANKKLIEKELAEAEEIAMKFPPINPYDTNGNGIDDTQEVQDQYTDQVPNDQTVDQNLDNTQDQTQDNVDQNQDSQT